VTSPVGCVVCHMELVDPVVLVCRRCREGLSPAVIEQTRRSLQQNRLVCDMRFSDTKKFCNRLRSAAHAAGFEPVSGAVAVSIIGQRSIYDGPILGAWEIVRDTIGDLAFGEGYELRSLSVTLIPGGYPWTMVSVRRMLVEEVAGVGGVSR
jgi:hypothetical protein